MIIPSIDLMNGQAVQLVGGKEKALDAGDPLPIAERFSVAGEIAVIDLDAALGRGSNAQVVNALVRRCPCRVGGGIRDVEAALKWLDAGAEKVILGTKAVPEILAQLPRERLIAALDAVHGEVVVEGWQTKTGRNILEKMVELRDFVSGFLVTFVEHEGRMQGSALERTGELLNAAGGARITVAGGITSAEEIAALAAQGIDAQVGMALYTNRLTLARAITAPLKSERSDGLWPTVVCDEHGIALGLAWSSQESVNEAVALRRGVYHSRKRGIWRKGETSGAAQELLRIDLDCDSDALRFTVRQHGSGFCHLGTRTCWGALRGIDDVFRHVQSRVKDAPPESYTKRLLDDSELLEAKLLEEAGEVVAAENSEEAVCEAADLLYFTLVKLIKNGASWSDVEAELGRRMLKVTRRPGLAKSRHS